MALKKHKIIALATSSVVLSSTLVTAGAVLSSNVISNIKKKQAAKASLNVAADANFKWSSDNTTILGFKDSITTSEIQALIVDSKLTLPECQYIAKGAFDFAFSKISTSFTIRLHKNVKEIGDNAFMGNTAITSLVFYDDSGSEVESQESYLTSIGLGAFEKTGLTSISIPNGCKIGDKAFYKCSSLVKIDLGNRSSLFTDIGSHAFQGISSTGQLVAPKMSNETANAMASNLETTTWGGLKFASTATTGYWTIADQAGTSTRDRTQTVPTIYLDIDSDTKELKAGLKRGSLSNYDTLYIPKEVVSLGSNAFVDTTTLKTVTFADNSACKTIGNDCFKGCTNIEGTLTLPASLRTIGRQAFYECSGITKLDMSNIRFGGSSRTFSVGTEAFYGWSEEPETDPIVYPTRESTSGMTQSQIEGVFAAALSNTGQINEYWISTGVKATDEEYAAATKTQKIQVEGDESYEYQITSFDWSAITTTGVTSIKFQPNSDDPDASQTIVSDLFYENGQSTLPTTITTIDMSKANIVEIGKNAFRGSSSITTVVLSDSTEIIDEGAFQDCTNLSGIALPSSLTSIGAKAFAGCDNAYYLDLSKLDEATLRELIAQETAERYSVIGKDCFEGYGDLAEAGGTILWSDDITDETLKDDFLALLKANGSLPDSWTKSTSDGEGVTGGIPIKDPYKTSDNEILVIENNVLTKINWANFEAYLDEVKAETGAEVTSIPLIIPRSVTSIGSNFWNAGTGKTTALANKINKLYFAIGSKCTSIESAAFSGATNFTGDLTIPEGVTMIYQSAFTGCTGFNGTLTLPSTISKAPGIGVWSFNGCSGFQTLDVSSWDNDFVGSWASGSQPIGNQAFTGWSNKAVVVPYAGITTTNLTTLQTYLKSPGEFPSTQFGEDASSYDVSKHGKLDPTEFETEAKLRLIDTQENKDALAEKYIDAINSDEVELKKGTTTETISGIELLKHDLMATFAQAYCDYADLGSKDPVININLSNIAVKGDRISFDVVANVNVYMETYEMGIATQFSTSVKNLHIVSTGAFARTRKTITEKQIGINFTVDTDTVFSTEYDKEYIYGNDEEGNYKESTIVDVTNTSFCWEELLSQFEQGVTYKASTAEGVKLHSLSRQAFAAAPGLFSAIFGVYDNTTLTGLTDGRDQNGMLYTPYLESDKDEDDNLVYTIVPFEGKFASPSFGEFSAYDISEPDWWTTQYSYGYAYTNYDWNYTNNTIQLQNPTGGMTTDEALAAYKTWLQNTTTYGTTLASGRLFKEDMAYSVCSAAQTYITSLFSTNKYTRLSANEFTFYQLYGKDDVPIDVLRVDDDGNLRATFGILGKMCLQDDDFVWDGTPPSGSETVSSFKHVFELEIPLEFHDVKLIGITQTEKNKLSLWEFADNIESSTDDSYMRIGYGSSSTSANCKLTTIEYDDDKEKFTTVYTLADKDDDYYHDDIRKELVNKGITTLSALEEYMESNWPLLYNLNFISPYEDDNGLHICLDFSSWYLKEITLK